MEIRCFKCAVDFVSSLLVSLPSRRAIFLNSNFLHIIPFTNFANQFICNPRGVFIGNPFILKWGMPINYFHKSIFSNIPHSSRICFWKNFIPWLLCNIVEEMVVVEIFKNACLNRAMTTSSLVEDFKSHEDQRMIADTEMNYTSFWCFSGELVIQRSINVLEVGVILVGSEINWLSPYISSMFVKVDELCFDPSWILQFRSPRR